MPAWITSELRELVCVPIASSLSRITTSRPASASSRATARPTTPAPTTTASSLSKREPPFERKRADAGERGGARHGAPRAVEDRAEQRAQRRAREIGRGADERGRRAGGLGKGRQREGRGARQHERRAEEDEGERHHEREPVLLPGPGERGGGNPAAEHQPHACAQQPRVAQA